MGASMCVEAKPSMFVLFPSWLDHYVLVHTTDEPRISISFNVKVAYPAHHPTAHDLPPGHGFRVHIAERHRRDGGATMVPGGEQRPP